MSAIVPRPDIGRHAARNIWVLAASLGGPEAIKEFLHALPPGLPVCLIYAQHIEANCSDLLTEVTARNSSYETGMLKAGAALYHGQLGIVPVGTELRFMPAGIESSGKGWPKPYAPTIDQVVADLAAVYGSSCGTIIFSGMGDDGATSCALLRQLGGTVWAQLPQSCICSSMPEEAIATGAVVYQARPAQLARSLAQRFSN